MGVLEKARLLSDAGRYDSCGPAVCDVDLQNDLGGVITAKAEHAHCRMFKTLMTNACSHDCTYCTNRAGCNKRKTMYEPQELARLFSFLRQKHRVNGLFLSSGVAGDADKTTEKMLEAARMIRHKQRFRGFLHFKVLPGVSKELVKQASEVADRMSVNIEAPNKQVLSELSSNKDFKHDILRRQLWIKKVSKMNNQTTQVIINDMASDKDVLRMMRSEYEHMGLRRVYYSAFTPVRGTPLERARRTPKWRERRLYNLDFLRRSYGFGYKELEGALDDQDMLTREDPKLIMARERYHDGPVDVNEAPYEELLRIPGIGPTTARRLASQKVSSYKGLRGLGANVDAARPFISLNGKRQTTIPSF